MIDPKDEKYHDPSPVQPSEVALVLFYQMKNLERARELGRGRLDYLKAFEDMVRWSLDEKRGKKAWQYQEGLKGRPLAMVDFSIDMLQSLRDDLLEAGYNE